jgi:hypothetical protein
MNNYTGILSYNFPYSNWRTYNDFTTQYIQQNYKILGGCFCSMYYSMNSNNIFSLNEMFDSHCNITYNGNEMVGYSSLTNYYLTNGINKLEYNLIEADCQPLTNGLLVSVYGKMRANYNLQMEKRFTEIFVINQNRKISKYIIRLYD